MDKIIDILDKKIDRLEDKIDVINSNVNSLFLFRAKLYTGTAILSVIICGLFQVILAIIQTGK